MLHSFWYEKASDTLIPSPFLSDGLQSCCSSPSNIGRVAAPNLAAEFSARPVPVTGRAILMLLQCAPANMKNLTNPTWIKAKGFLFLVLGLLSAALLLFEHPAVHVALLLIVTVWSFCRFYYFVFYVIEHYVDPNYRFSGFFSFVRYLIRSQRKKP